MTMHRRPLGQGRLLAALGAVLILIASFLAWYTAGGDAGGLNPISCSCPTRPATGRWPSIGA